MLLGYLIAMEAKELDEAQTARMEADLKTQLWIHDWERYDKLYGANAEITQMVDRDEQIEWTVPETPEDLRELAALAGLVVPDD